MKLFLILFSLMLFSCKQENQQGTIYHGPFILSNNKKVSVINYYGKMSSESDNFLLIIKGELPNLIGLEKDYTLKSYILTYDSTTVEIKWEKGLFVLNSDFSIQPICDNREIGDGIITKKKLVSILNKYRSKIFKTSISE